MPVQLLHVGSVNDHSLIGLFNEVTLVYPIDATVTVSIADALGAPVTGAQSLAMLYIGGTVGASSVYRASIPSSVAFIPDAHYTATVTATDTGGNVRKFVTDYLAVVG